MYERGERTTYEAVVSLTDQSVVSWRTDPGRAGADHGGGVHRLRGDRAGRPALAGGHAQARRHRLLPRRWSTRGRRAGPARTTTPPARRDRAAADLRALGAGRERLRPPGRGPDRAWSTSTRARSSRSSTTASCRCRRSRATTRSRGSSSPGNVPAFDAFPRRRQADRDHPARGPELHRRRPRRRLAEVARPDRLHPARGPGPAPGRLRRAGSIVHRASLVEMYVPYGDPAPTHRFKNVFDQGEYGVGLAGQLARRSAATASGTSTTSTASSTTTTATPS